MSTERLPDVDVAYLIERSQFLTNIEIIDTQAAQLAREVQASRVRIAELEVALADAERFRVAAMAKLAKIAALPDSEVDVDWLCRECGASWSIPLDMPTCVEHHPVPQANLRQVRAIVERQP